MEYRNIKTGVVIEVSSKINGENWEAVKKPPIYVVKDEKDAPKKTTRKK